MKKTIGIFPLVVCLLILFISFSSCKKDSSSNDATGTQLTSIPLGPSDAYLSRKEQYLIYCNENSGPGSNNFYGQVCRAYTGDPYDETPILNALNKINNREDTSDFRMNAILRILLLDRQNPTLPDDLRDAMNDTVLGFKYWLDEPGPDDMCWWSENHQILFHTAELLAGILFPDVIFSNSGMTGREHMEHARPMIQKWFDYRCRFGFSEWHSNIYFNEDMPPLVNLVDFADDEDIRTRAAMLLDILAFDMTCNYYKSKFATTHGRTYDETIINGLNDSTEEQAWLMANLVDIESINDLGSGSFTATFLATSDNYFTPQIIENIADDSRNSMVHRQRDSIKLDDGPSKYGIGYSDFQDVMFWWGMTGYLAPEIVEGSFDMIDYYDLWKGYQWKDLVFLKPLVGTSQMIGIVTDIAPMSRGATLEEVNTYTYRTPYYQLSGAQDWKPFNWAGQVTMWQATLDKNCYVFTSLPADLSILFGTDFGSDWTGGFVPRVTMNKNVGIFQYHLPPLGDLEEYFGTAIPWDSILTEKPHAYFPRDNFDEGFLSGKWLIARKGDAYIALYSSTTMSFPAENNYEVVSSSTDNIWIVELGDVEHNGSFANFVSSIENAVVEIAAKVHYESPSQGVIEVGWTGPMTVNGEEVDLGPYARWENQYSYQEFGTMVTPISFGGQLLLLDFNTPNRGLYLQ